jgi:hypothetical protein
MHIAMSIEIIRNIAKNIKDTYTFSYLSSCFYVFRSVWSLMILVARRSFIVISITIKTRPRKDILPRITRLVIQLYSRIIFIRNTQCVDLKGHLRVDYSLFLPAVFGACFNQSLLRHFSRVSARLGIVLRQTIA